MTTTGTPLPTLFWEPVPIDTPVSDLVDYRLLVVGDNDVLVFWIDPPRTVEYGELAGQFVVSGWRQGARFPRAKTIEVPGFMTVAALALNREVVARRAYWVDAAVRYERPLVTVGDVEMPVDEAVRRLPVTPDRYGAAHARVSRIRTLYGRMLADIAYRIENSAMFDSAVPTTAAFETALALWSDVTERTPRDEVIRRSAVVAVTFDTARAHAETVGLAHLPHTARDDARRAAGAARLARSAGTDAEREAAEAQVVRILGSLALYYLPRPDDFRRAIARR